MHASSGGQRVLLWITPPSLWALYAVPAQHEDVDAIRAGLGEPQFAEVWAGGEQLELNAALDQALDAV
jgi:hypothetical protein